MEKVNDNEPWKDWSYYDYRDLLLIPTVFVTSYSGLVSFKETEITGRPGYATAATSIIAILFSAGLYKMHDVIIKRNYEKYNPLNPEK